MFGIGSAEIAFILLIGLMIFGPEHLPQIARKVGKFVRQAKKFSDDVSSVVKKEVTQLERIAQLEEMKKQAQEISEATVDVAKEIKDVTKND